MVRGGLTVWPPTASCGDCYRVAHLYELGDGMVGFDQELREAVGRRMTERPSHLGRNATLALIGDFSDWCHPD